MLLPHFYIRQKRLARALQDYTSYDPPWKVEERILPPEKAQENFEYFLSQRASRQTKFVDWLDANFGAKPSFEHEAVEELIRWTNDYIPVLLPYERRRDFGKVFYAYAEPWTGEFAALNFLMDLGTFFGDVAIFNRPGLRWNIQSNLILNQASQARYSGSDLSVLRELKMACLVDRREKYSGYNRPILIAPDDPCSYLNIFSKLDTLFFVKSQAVTLAFARKEWTKPKALRISSGQSLLDWYRRVSYQIK